MRPGRNELRWSAVKRLATLLLAVLFAAPAVADDDALLNSIIVSMAQHFVQEQYMLGALGHYHIEFDMAYVHPQPQPDFWAVVGGFVSDQYTPNTYVAAIRLTCADYENVECWRLEKLAINGEFIVDEGQRL